jgi:GNAT superfamily N-acetyltransferase
VATWPLPQFDSIEITYTTEDRFGEEGPLDPDMEFAQQITGDVVGVYEDEVAERRIPLGRVELGRINLSELHGNLFDVLDSCSGEWSRFVGLADQIESDDQRDDRLMFAHALVLIDVVELAPEARGHGLGLHVLARVIRTWAGDGSIVGLIAGPLTDESRRYEAPEATGDAEALARHWSRLGLERYEDEGEDPDLSPLLVGYGTRQSFLDRVASFCLCESPEQDSLGR